MATHSSTLAWKIPWTVEPGRLHSMGSLRVWHYWVTSLSFFTFMRWRRKWQPTPVFLPGESQGRGSLVGFRLWGRTESDTTEVMQRAGSRLCGFKLQLLDWPSTIYLISLYQFLHLQYGQNTRTYLVRLFGGINELTQIKYIGPY